MVTFKTGGPTSDPNSEYAFTIIVEPGLVAKVPAEPSHTASKLGSIPTLPYAPRFTLLCEPGVW